MATDNAKLITTDYRESGNYYLGYVAVQLHKLVCIYRATENMPLTTTGYSLMIINREKTCKINPNRILVYRCISSIIIIVIVGQDSVTMAST